MPVVTLLTDYGPGSEHVGALHAVIASGCTSADRIDLAHDIPPGDVRFGALVLARLVPLAPVGVHLAVVDPGVGTARRAVAVATDDGRVLVGPDNGLLAPACGALGAVRAVELTSATHRREPVAATFHGRDVFAPAAAFLAGGGGIDDLGPRIDVRSLGRLDLPSPVVVAGRLEATVVGVDRFGNVELMAGGAELAALGGAGPLRVVAHGAELPARVAAVFADVAPDEALVHLDAHGSVAVAIRDGSAGERLGVAPGSSVTIERM